MEKNNKKKKKWKMILPVAVVVILVIVFVQKGKGSSEPVQEVDVYKRQAGRGDHAAFIGCGTKSSGGSRVRKDFIKSIYKSD